MNTKPLIHLRPKLRSSSRIWLGSKYYTYKRYLKWIRNRKKFAQIYNKSLLPYCVISHHTPTLRKLKDVDMWMQHNKVMNLKIAIQKLNYIAIQPGETFSYWKLIGKITKQKGYVDGMILHYGKFSSGTGGGLCQLSNLIYWITLHTPLVVTERHRHSYDVFPDAKRTQPFGSGATCVYNYLDLQIYNATSQTYQLYLNIKNDQLIGEWRTTHPPIHKYKIYEKDHAITQEYWGDYVRHNIIHRKVLNLNDECIEDQYVTENHAIMMYQPLLK
ncbi:VanW family protein [Chengkuizengella axinellae]|uniref:VanW family protein n=1 Tax=Chengkuizengella axinellae TaxID=3064388 RepID=A0ABT9IXK0_9BACL|nr:VanW family protein [Chengkuizengella sp. 2205SS18-9]MDP5273525.1 VanW family protein [Chengkuizengella sp. 2205SS18-9]